MPDDLSDKTLEDLSKLVKVSLASNKEENT